MPAAPPAPPADAPIVFRRLLVNTLVSGVTSSFLWFALTFWVYLETRSVVATGVIGGAFGLASAAIGPAFGTYVDHHRKKAAMVLATDDLGGVLRGGDAGVRRRRPRRAAAARRAPGSGSSWPPPCSARWRGRCAGSRSPPA